MANRSERLLFYKKKWGGNPYYYYHFIKIRKKYRYQLYRVLNEFLLFYRDFTFKHSNHGKKPSKFYFDLVFAFLKWATKLAKENIWEPDLDVV